MSVLDELLSALTGGEVEPDGSSTGRFSDPEVGEVTHRAQPGDSWPGDDR